MDKKLNELLKSQLADAYYQENEPGLVAVMKGCLEKDYINPQLLPLVQESLARLKEDRRLFVEAHRC